MHFLRVNVTFYDAVNMIYVVIRTVDPFPCTAKFMCCRNLEIIKLNKSNAEIYIEYVHSVVVYQKYLSRLGEVIIFEPWLENYQFSQPS